MKIEKIVKETYKLQEQVKELQEQITNNKQLIQEYFDENDSLEGKSIIAGDIKVTQVDSAYVSYNGYQLEESLRKNKKKSLIDLLIKKTYSIANIKAFTKLIKLTGITPFELKKHLQIDRSVDSNAVKRLFEKGDLVREDLDGCFESKIVKSIRLTKINTSEGD